MGMTGRSLSAQLQLYEDGVARDREQAEALGRTFHLAREAQLDKIRRFTMREHDKLSAEATGLRGELFREKRHTRRHAIYRRLGDIDWEHGVLNDFRLKKDREIKGDA